MRISLQHCFRYEGDGGIQLQALWELTKWKVRRPTTPTSHTSHAPSNHSFQTTPPNHAFQPQLPTTASDHSFQPQLPTTHSNHTFQPQLPTTQHMLPSSQLRVPATHLSHVSLHPGCLCFSGHYPLYRSIVSCICVSVSGCLFVPRSASLVT